MSTIYTILISIVTSTTASIVTFLVTVRANRINKDYDLTQEKKIKYFFPFKYYSTEFLERLLHIENLAINTPHILWKSFNSSFTKKKLEWYFIDYFTQNGKENLGGYFFASTIYMQCILFYKIKMLQQEHPYLKVTIDPTVIYYINRSSQLKRCLMGFSDNGQFEDKLNKIKSARDITEEIRVATIMKNGVHYSLHDSFGDFVSDSRGLIDYERFCGKLIDNRQRIKFFPLIIFWRKLVSHKHIDETVLQKIRRLIIILTIAKHSDIK